MLLFESAFLRCLRCPVQAPFDASRCKHCVGIAATLGYIEGSPECVTERVAALMATTGADLIGPQVVVVVVPQAWLNMWSVLTSSCLLQLDTLQRQMSQLDASMSANSHPSSMSVPACNPLKQPAAAYQVLPRSCLRGLHDGMLRCPSVQPDCHGGGALHYYAVATFLELSMMALLDGVCTFVAVKSGLEQEGGTP